MRLADLVTLALVLSGCGSNISMGEVPDGSLSDAPGVDGTPSSSSITGRWVGYIEGHKLPSGSDAVTIEVTEPTDGTAAGTVIFGTKPAPPPPTNKDARYPSDLVVYAGPGSQPIPFAGEGFRYRMGKGRVSGKRLTTQINSRELWRTWCELQTSYPLDPVMVPGFYQCLPNWPTSFGEMCSQTDPSGVVVPRDCGQVVLCNRGFVDPICECTATGCGMTKTSDEISDISFDVTFAGDQMNGSITGLLGDKTVHLTRSK